MSYDIGQIKVLAYNNDCKEDFTITERNLYIGLAYCYGWFRSHPEDKDKCEMLMNDYIFAFQCAQFRELESATKGSDNQ